MEKGNTFIQYRFLISLFYFINHIYNSILNVAAIKQDRYCVSSIYVGGETIGIAVQSKGVYVVGFYPVEGEYIGKENGFLEGDIIVQINQAEISSIDDLYSELEKDESFSVEVLRNNQFITLNPKFSLQESSLKTGLYVKDNIQGIGTLSYIDPETHVFGSLGHEIVESSSQSRFLINQGAIFKAEVDSVRKSEYGVVGSKKAVIDSNKDIGIIEANEEEGIFGFYQDDIQDKELMEIAKPSEIKRGKAVIRTVLEDNKIEEYDIQVLTIEDSLDTKNIFKVFSITFPCIFVIVAIGVQISIKSLSNSISSNTSILVGIVITDDCVDTAVVINLSKFL